MTIVRAQIAFGADLPEPRHRFVITPHFNHTLLAGPSGQDWDAFANSLGAAMASWTGRGEEIQVKLYDAEAPRPNFPKAVNTRALGTFPVSTMPRELALCLSYVCGNGPRRRGRLYLPGPILSPTGQAGKRPSQGMLDKAVALAGFLRDVGGLDVKWGVWSRRDSAFFDTETAYVDDEWDVVRSRGTVATKRESAGSGD